MAEFSDSQFLRILMSIPLSTFGGWLISGAFIVSLSAFDHSFHQNHSYLIFISDGISSFSTLFILGCMIRDSVSFRSMLFVFIFVILASNFTLVTAFFSAPTDLDSLKRFISLLVGFLLEFFVVEVLVFDGI